jgi:hypothetical protein
MQNVQMLVEPALIAGSELRQPILKGLLVRRFNGAEPNPHSIRPRIGHDPRRDEGRSVMIDSYAHFRPPRKGRRRFDEAAKGAQIPGVRHNLFFGLHIHDLRSGRERVSRRAMLSNRHKRSMSLFPRRPWRDFQ